MTVGTMIDWVERVFGFAFLLFMLYVLLFPNGREPPDANEGPLSLRNSDQGNQTTSQPISSEIKQVEQRHGKIVVFPVHRRTHG